MVKPLIACALTRRSICRCRWPASLSKRAPSTTRTSLRVFGINRLRASGSARKPNCDRNCDTPPKGLRSFTGVRALEHARRLQELLQTCRRIQGCLECGPTFGTENEVAPVQRFSAAHPPHVARSLAHAHYSLKVTLVP